MSQAKAKEPFDKETLRKQYEEICPKYERLVKNLKEALEVFVKEAQIDHIGVFSRVKEFESFWKKMHRKGYDKPFQQTEDICGVRVVCLYVSDMDKVKEIISKEFDVIKWVDKRKQLKPDQFGYLSLHAIVTVKKDWLNAPNYRGLDGVKAEIQIRTTLMHAWGEVEHKLSYKEEGVVPDEYRRQFYQLSAQLEGIDRQFDALRKEREKSKEAMLEKAKKSGEFDVNQPLNLDSLQALLDFYFPEAERRKSWGHTNTLLNEMTEHRVTMRDITEGFEKVKDILPKIEEEMWQDHPIVKKLAQIGAARLVLDLTKDNFWEWRNDVNIVGRKWIIMIQKWRRILADENRKETNK